MALRGCKETAHAPPGADMISLGFGYGARLLECAAPAEMYRGKSGQLMAMRGETGENSSAVRLTTWKQIAAFLGRDERTVKRWEESRGLPVRRLPGNGRASVFAYAHELRAWQDGNSGQETLSPDVVMTRGERSPTAWKQRSRIAVATATLLVLAAALFVVWLRAPGEPDVSGTRDAAAAEYYQSGMHDWQTRTPSGLARAVADFNAAIRRDPRFADAYVGLANTYNLMREFTRMPAEEAYAKAADAATRAMAINPSLSGAHAALAFTDFYWRRDVAGANREFSRAIALDPRNATAHHWYATFLMTIGSVRAAREQIDRAARLDPESTAILADKGLILFYAGAPQQAVALLRQLETDQPLFASPHLYLSAIHLMQRDDAGYLREMNLEADALHDATAVQLAAAGAHGFRAGGREGMLRALLTGHLALYAKGKDTAYAIAQIYALLGDRRNALAYLSASLSREEPEMAGMKINPLFAPFRNTPEFRRLQQEAGLDVRV